MRKETLQLCYGCLLHDIGKLVYRSGGEGGDHSRLGRDFLARLWPQEKEILDCLGLHHAARLRQVQPPPDSLAWIACVADDLSAAADRREKPEEEGGSFRRYQPLESVFSHMNGEHPGYAIEPYPQDGTLRMPKRELRELSPGRYQDALRELEPRLRELPREEKWLDSLLCLLESYTSVFPSSTFTGESPDISLYDHLKTTAAIGACIGEYLAEQGEGDYKGRVFTGEARFRQEEAFLLYSADLSGIQSFLYTVATDKALRSLRSRSFFLELVMEHYMDELLRLCGLSRVNLLYSGGGHCYALLPNTREVREAIEAWGRRFNGWLCEQFGAALFLAQGWTPCTGNDLINQPAEEAPYRAMFRRVSSRLSWHKLHRYDGDMLRQLNRPLRPGGRECKVCGRTDRLEGDRCPWCRLFVELSDKIQTMDIYLVSREAGPGYDLSLPGSQGEVYISLIREDQARARLDKGEDVLRIYSKNRAYTGLSYSTRLYVGDYAYSSRMEELARKSAGIRRIGICRMDVDDLGRSFVSGFEQAEKKSAAQRQHFVTISRTSAFSRQLSLFFKCYINQILSGSYGGGPPLAVTVVYSGGDDVFLVGSWNDALEAAGRIERAFRQFCCGSLTISAGLWIAGERYPIRLAAERAGELEDRAKEEPGKSSVSLFDPAGEHTYHWDRFYDRVMGEKLGLIRSFFRDDSQERGMAFLYRLLELLRQAQEKDGRLQLARYAYLLARLEPSPSSPGYAAYKDFAGKMYRWALDEGSRQELITAIYIYVYEQRKGDEERGV